MGRNILPTFVVGVVVCAMLYLIATKTESYPEVRQLQNTLWTEQEYNEYFAQLANIHTPTYAFEVLRRALLPEDINTHTIAHTIGYVLFEEKGIEGMRDCTQDFRNGCSHALVIQAFIEDGAQAQQDIVHACSTAPGGTGAQTICFHGVGHGLMAFLKYDFEEAVQECQSISSILVATQQPTDVILSEHRFISPEAECVGGAVMELFQGTHDQLQSAQALFEFAPENDMYMPCDAEYLSQENRSACYTALTERFFGAVGAGREIPSENLYEPAMAFCAHAPDEDSSIACYGGFGKEYVFYATQRDGGDVNHLSDSALKNIRTWCAYAGNEEGEKRCNAIALDSLFWAGQNSVVSAQSFCRVGNTAVERSLCFTQLKALTSFFK